MIFKQYRNGSCDIEFSKEEINIIKKKKQLHLPPETLKHFSNTLIRIVGDWHAYFDEHTKDKVTDVFTKIEGK